MDSASDRPEPDLLRQACLEARMAGEAADRGEREAAMLRLEAAVAALGPLPVLCAPLADLLQGLERWSALAALCRRASEAREDRREAAIWQLRLAAACEALGETEAAVAAHRAALAARPRDLQALHALQRLHRQQGEHAALARALEGELALRAGDEEIAPRLELAQLLAGPLGRGPEALVHVRRVLDLAPNDAETLSVALRLAERLGAAAEQVALLEIALARGSSDASRARLLARQAALLAGPLENPSQAIPRWREALALDASIPGAGEGLRTAFEALSAWPALLECLHEEAQRAGADARRGLLERGAQIATEHLGADAALPWLERLRAHAPREAAIVARIAGIHRSAGRVPALRACLDAELALDPPPERARVLERERAALLPEAGTARKPAPAGPAAETPRATARVSADAAGAHPEKMLVPTAASPGDVLAAALRPSELLAAAASPSELLAAAAAAESELAALDPGLPVFLERRRALARTLAHLYLDALGDPERARPHLRALVAIEPDARGIAGLQCERDWAERELLAGLRAEGSHGELATRLAARLEREPEDATGWLELARLRELALYSPAAAAAAYRRALAHGAPPAEALPGLRRTSEALGDWGEVARALEAELAEDPPPPQRAMLLRTLGDVAWRRLGATTRASRAFAGALEADPRDLISLRALQQLLASMEDWRGALDLVESELELLPAAAAGERRRLWLRAAAIAAERVGDAERAIRAFDAADALAPLDREARWQLAVLLHRTGARERYVALASALCDAPDAEPDASAELRLAGTLHNLGRPEEARARVKRALGIAPLLAGAWELLAEIRLVQGAPDEAAESLVRAAEHAAPAAAVARLLRAATLVEAEDLEFAHGLREGACARDVASISAQAARARSALALGRVHEAGDAAIRAVELALAPGASPDASALIETTLAVSAAARSAALLDVAARLLDAAQGLAPSHPELLRARAEVLFAQGDRRGARRAVAALLAHDEPSRKDAGLLVIEGEGLEDEAALDEAAERFAEAARLDPTLEAAWAGLGRAHERAGRPLEAMRALDGWAEAAAASVGAACRLRAAALALAHGEAGAGERRLRQILRSDPGCTGAHRLLARHRLESGAATDALAIADQGLAYAADAPSRAALQGVRARALESLGLGDEACVAYAAVLDDDPDALDAARNRSALLRAAGAWREAAAALEGFLANARSVPAAALAELWLALSQLRAGPLGDVAGACVACVEALRLRPSFLQARESLADLVTQDTDRRAEALARHRELLEATPDRVGSLEALAALAETLGRSTLAADFHALLACLGRSERDEGRPERIRIRVAPEPRLENPVWERARLLAHSVAREISRALEASEVLEPPETGGAIEGFRLAAIVAEAELAGPGLVPLRDDEAGAVLAIVAALAAERAVISGDGRLVNALALELGRGARRRAREALGGASPEEIAEIDFPAWRAALRALSHAVALDATGGDLRSALDAVADEGATAESSPASRELLRRVVMALGRALANEGGER
jgi:hypothetical protein